MKIKGNTFDREQIVKNHIDVLMTKMFEAVNLDWSNPEVKADYDVFNRESQWYLRNEWTEKQQVEYMDWLTDYFMNNAGARRALLNGPSKSRKRCYLAAMQFTSWYGWKTKKEQA